MATVILLVIVGVVLLTVLGFTAVRSVRSRRGRVEIEPPAPPPIGREAETRGATAAPTEPAPPPPDELVAEIEEALAAVTEPEVVEAPPKRPSFRERLGRARATFSGFVGRATIDDETWDDLEEALIRADIGVGPATAAAR